ncbi:MAG: hypothetical protein EOP50_03995 [Sphingobacteriales bacterium]|nr:MAG: hypothetical protein EOP50_03995 [Sphingobacteriales bacterium]
MEYFTPATLFSLALVIGVTLFILYEPKKWAAKASARRFPGYRKMDRTQRRLLIRFHQLPHTELWKASVWQLGIQKVCAERSVTRFNLLIDELRSQCQDNAAHMISIIGIDIYQLLQVAHPKATGTVIKMGYNDSGVHGEWHPATN